ncbi:hypothetical protein [Sphingosinicella sp.]|uniref:hypothetical protein n=1 Tax=Sphingosinicella sp. TaxID=1917971 RepID=UPI004037D047
MKETRKLNRRSFLAKVAGGAAIGGGALAVIAPAAAQTGITDRDPGDRVGYGRGGGTGLTDADSGPGADPAGRGRGASGPPRGVGEHTGVTDADTGSSADPPQRGRGRQFGADVNVARQCQAQECQAARGQINIADYEIRRRETLIGDMQRVYGELVGSLPYARAQPDQYAATYANRVAGVGLSVSSNNDPYNTVAQLDQRMAQVRQELVSYRQYRAQIVTLMQNYNCP